jgi:hypothetical protein
MKAMPMKMEFNSGHHMTWYAEAGHALATLTRETDSAIASKGCTTRACKEASQYLIQSETTDHLDTHKGATLKKRKGER